MRRIRCRAARLTGCVLQGTLLLAACSGPGVELRFDAHLVHDHGDIHGMPTKVHSAEALAGKGEIRISGKVPLGGRCPIIRADAERDGKLISVHVDTHPADSTVSRPCSVHVPVMGEYIAVLTGLRAGSYKLVVHHDSESEPDSTDGRIEYNMREVLRREVQIR